MGEYFGPWQPQSIGNYASNAPALYGAFGVAMRSWPGATWSAAVPQLTGRVAQARTVPDQRRPVLRRHYHAMR